MRRAVARGRMFPQSFSTDRRYGRLSLKAIGLLPLMWANSDDQGRLCGDPEEVKYAVCPNIDHITKKDIPVLLAELQEQKLIYCYTTPESPAIQILDWWKVNHKMQWAWPSDYPPPDGWTDHLRYKQGAKVYIEKNWPINKDSSGEYISGGQVEQDNANQVSHEKGMHMLSGENINGVQVKENSDSGEDEERTPPKTPSFKEKDKLKRGRERGKSPDCSGEEDTTANLYTHGGDEGGEEEDVYATLILNFRMRWGTVKGPNFMETQPREPTAKESKQLRDLAKELETHGVEGRAIIIKEAFDEAVKAGKHKMTISYVRAILLDWIGVER